MTRIDRWVIDQGDATHRPMATEVGQGWLELVAGRDDVEIRFCEAGARMYVPIEVLRQLVAESDRRRATVTTP